MIAILAILSPFAPGIPFLPIILGTFDDLLVKILLLAAVISFVLASFGEYYSFYLILYTRKKFNLFIFC